MKTLLSIAFTLLISLNLGFAQGKVETVVQSGHVAPIFDMEFSPDGKLLATGSRDQMIKLWESKTGRLVRTLSGHSNWVTALAFSPDNKYLASGGADKNIFIWNIETGERDSLAKGKFEHYQMIRDIQFSRDGKKLFTASNDGKIIVWDLEAKKYLSVVMTGFGISSLSINPKNEKVAFTPAWTEDYNFKPVLVRQIKHKNLDDWELGKEVYRFTQNKEFASTKGLYTPDGKYLAILMWQGEIRIYDAKTLKLVKTLNHISYATDMDISADGKYIAAVSGYARMTPEDQKKNNFVKVWNLQTGEVKAVWNQKDVFTTNKIRFDKTGQYLAVANASGDVRLWQWQTKRLTRTFKGFTNIVRSVDIHPKKRLIASASSDSLVRLWDLTADRTEILQTFSGHKDGVSVVRFAYQNNVLASGSYDESINLWNLNSNKLIRTLAGYDTSKYIFRNQVDKSLEWVNAMTFSFNDKYIFSGSGGSKPSEYNLKIWETATGKLASSVKSKYPIQAVELHRLGLLMVADGGGTFYEQSGKVYSSNRGGGDIRMYNMQTNGSLDKTLSDTKKPSPIKCLSIAANQAFVMSGHDDGHFRIRNLDGTMSETYKAHEGVIWAIDSDKRYVYTGGGDNNINVFYFGKSQALLKGHESDVLTLKAKLDRRKNKTLYLVSGGADGKINIWHPQYSKDPLLTLVGFNQSNDYVITTPEGYYMYTGDANKILSFKKANKVYSFKQFDLKYNRPDKVFEQINKINPKDTTNQYSKELIDAYKKAYQKRLKRLGLTEDLLGEDIHAPEIQMLNDNIENRTSSSKITFNVKATDSKYNLNRLNVWVNAVPIFGRNGFDLSNKPRKDFEKALNVELSEGENEIEVSVHNEKGVESLRERFTITYENSLASKPTLYLVSIGVSSYKDKKMSLQYATKDSKDLTDLFTNNKTSYSAIKTFNINDKKATNKNILSLRNQLLKTKVNDHVIIFYAGHGVLDKNLDYYLATYDMNFANPKDKGLLYDDLESLLDGIPARQKILLMDACHSGEIDKDEVKLVTAKNTEKGKVKFREAGQYTTESKTTGLNNSFELMRETFTDLRKGTGSTVIASAGGVEVAWESEDYQNGVFTYCLLTGLKDKKADLNKDGKVMLSELQNYLQKAVPELTKGTQQPTSRIENLENDFRIW